MTTNPLNVPLVEGVNWYGDRRHYVSDTGLGDDFKGSLRVPALCGAYVQSRDWFGKHFPRKQFGGVPLCAHCKRLAGNQQVAGRPTLEQCVATVKDLFVSAGLVDLDADDYAYDAARAIRQLYGDEDES